MAYPLQPACGKQRKWSLGGTVTVTPYRPSRSSAGILSRTVNHGRSDHQKAKEFLINLLESVYTSPAIEVVDISNQETHYREKMH